MISDQNQGQFAFWAMTCYNKQSLFLQESCGDNLSHVLEVYIYNASLVMYRIRVAAFCCVWLLALLLLLHPLLVLMIEIGYCYATIRVIEIFQKTLFWAFESNFFHLQGEIFIPKLFQINPTCVITGCSFVTRTFAPRLGD